MGKHCNGCMEGELIFKVSGAIAIHDLLIVKPIVYLPNEDLDDQYWCEKHARTVDYLREILEEAEIVGKISEEEIRMIEKELDEEGTKPLTLKIVIHDKDRFTSKAELKHRINKSLSECLVRWTLEEI